jgi:hypothetical protein
MRGSARFQEYCRSGLLRHIQTESRARETTVFLDVTRPPRHGDLEDRLCEVDGDGRMLHVDSSMPWPVTRPFTDWHDDAAWQEESIPSAAAAERNERWCQHFDSVRTELLMRRSRLSGRR